MRTMQKPARLRPVCRSSLVVYLVLVSEDRHSRALDRSSSSSLLDNAHTGSLLHSRTSSSFFCHLSLDSKLELEFSNVYYCVHSTVVQCKYSIGHV